MNWSRTGLPVERRHQRRGLGRVVVRRGAAERAAALVVGHADPVERRGLRPQRLASTSSTDWRVPHTLCVLEKIRAPPGVDVGDAALRPDRRGRVVVELVGLRELRRRRHEGALEVAEVRARRSAGAWPAASMSRIFFNRFPLAGSFGRSPHVTLSWAAAWIACHSVGATTPTKSLVADDLRARICLIELSSTERTFGAVPPPYAPWPRGRTTRPCTMPGTRMLWTYVKRAAHLVRDVDARDAVRADELVLADRLRARRTGGLLRCGRHARRAAGTLGIRTLNSLSPSSAP